MEEAHRVEPEALMIWSVIVRLSEGGEGGGFEQSHQSASGTLTQSFLIGRGTQPPCEGPAASAGVLMLCRHEILMVKEAKEGCREEAGSNPPGEEGEKASEKQRAEDSPQAPEGH